MHVSNSHSTQLAYLCINLCFRTWPWNSTLHLSLVSHWILSLSSPLSVTSGSDLGTSFWISGRTEPELIWHRFDQIHFIKLTLTTFNSEVNLGHLRIKQLPISMLSTVTECVLIVWKLQESKKQDKNPSLIPYVLNSNVFWLSAYTLLPPHFMLQQNP